MRLLEAHNKPHKDPWFTGKRVICKHCGSIWQFESKDAPYEYVKSGKRMVSFGCAQCGKASADHEPA